MHVYGASTKGNTILQYADIDQTSDRVRRRPQPDKWGSETMDTEIEIISEEESRAMNPDYYLVLPGTSSTSSSTREESAAGGSHRAAARCAYRRRGREWGR